MSWSCQVPATHPDEIEDAIIDAPVTGQDTNETHVFKAVKAAKECALHILEQGAVGDDTHQYTISMGGHANKEHQPSDPWVNDTITVSVRQA